jgi:5'-nucleotidase
VTELAPLEAAPPDILQFAEPPPTHRGVFVNRNLRMDTVQTIGFDMDYTIARYHRERLEELAHRLTVQKLVQRGYPAEIEKLAYDRSFVIRGLTVDKQFGNILKIDRHNHVGRVFHGRRRLSKRERRELYRRERLSFIPPRFALVDTLFSLPEMCLYADLVDYLEAKNGKKLDTWRLFDDTRECIDEAHRDESLKSIVKKSLPEYVEKDPLLARTLHKLRSSGKKLFLLTNSLYDYTNAVMTYLLDGELPEYPSWRSYFEVVVVGARKPDFFTGDEPIAEIDAAGHIVARPIDRFERGKIYQGGNLRAFETALRIGGEQILYVGDHIYGDILRSKKHTLWRTGLVVEEIEDEILRTVEHRDKVLRLQTLETRRRQLDDLANSQRRSLAAMDKVMGDEARQAPEYGRLRKERDAAKREMKRVLTEMEHLEQTLDRAFNPNWGMVFKEERENSRFGEQVAEYACIYTSRVSNFFFYSAYQYFRSPRDLLPHEQVLEGL